LYKCQIKNVNRQMQVYLTLSTEALSGKIEKKTRKAPTFFELPKIIVLNNGKLVQMISRYQASEKCYCSWSKNGKPISESPTSNIFHEKISSRTYEYRAEIEKPSENDAGLYKCQIANEHGQMQVYLHLDIERCLNIDEDLPFRMTRDAPTFIKPPKIVYLNDGQLIQMIAKYQAKEQCYCSWSKKGISLSESENVQVHHKKVNSNYYEYKLEVHDPTPDLSGLYKCLVGNDNGQNQVYLIMDVKEKSGVTKKNNRDAPSFIDAPKIMIRNGSIHMIARYQANEQCQFNWSKDGFSITDHPSQKIQVSHRRLNTNYYEYRVEIPEPNKKEVGLYKCLVVNNDGQIPVYFNLDC